MMAQLVEAGKLILEDIRRLTSDDQAPRAMRPVMEVRS